MFLFPGLLSLEQGLTLETVQRTDLFCMETMTSAFLQR